MSTETVLLIRTGSKCGFRVTKAEPDVVVFFTRCSFIDIVLLPRRLSLSAHAICCFNDGAHITNYTAQRCLLSLVNADIHQYPISPSWSHRLCHPAPNPPPMEKSPVVVVQQSNFHCNIRRFVLGLHTSGKANIGGSLSSLCLQSPSPATVGINDSDERPDRLQAANIKAVLELKGFDLGLVSSHCARGCRKL